MDQGYGGNGNMIERRNQPVFTQENIFQAEGQATAKAHQQDRDGLATGVRDGEKEPEPLAGLDHLRPCLPQ